uniref:Putative uracil DNA glycosylase superfamily protein n=1 Tax=viral metagenome TaxID=1070528 RepID=A0A6M3JLW2_9ZZZZ
MNLNQIASQILNCQRCGLRENASAPVPGVGSPTAKYLILGEAPGKNEDKYGVPFVGAAGRRLNRLLDLAGIDINDCYLSNVCHCWPPKVKGKQRAPRKAERLACYPWLKAEVSIIKPSVVIPLGATPLSLFTDTGITQLHGTQFQYEWEIDE